ncbi:MAG: hypothetical protein IIA91_09730 [Chloroflexi bacterium]|nr:hypothetical protein [Chloroflexota bacterium]
MPRRRTPSQAGVDATEAAPSAPSADSLAGPRRAPVRGQAGQGLDFLFHPRSVAIAGASPPQPGFGGM